MGEITIYIFWDVYMNTKTRLRISAILFAICGGAFALLYPLEKVEAPSPEIYDQNSREKLIAEECKTFFDGCNSCFRSENGETACTRKYCENYEKPYCTDEENQATEQVKNSENVPVCDENDPLSQCEISQELWKEEVKEISREEAENLIIEGKVKSIFQSHNLEVRLTTEEWIFLTKEPVIDTVFTLIKKCWENCTDILLATE